ncbi:MAG: family 20 glycosylhydrolase [Bacteroidetes bacterium]|nr:family 20 glycosylhydrolase [Bacteroidota bacterium]MBT3750647.1 family 20 glycosylhydrolase [Bacteroidota bacterium]MBT4398136.1 family 20 glycosylhydrolase [Bacteroidota bacterium]MBT7463979.1 family 20 glycosylhydrolase [Bacteroidota bacterium]
MKLLIPIVLLFSSMIVSCSDSGSEDKPTEKSTELFESRFSALDLQDAPLKLIPYPQEVTWSRKKTKISSLSIINPDELNENMTKALKDMARQKQLTLTPDGSSEIALRHNTDFPDEAYHLSVSGKKILIESSSEKGSFYALQTLSQLIESKEGSSRVQNCDINDFPVHQIRGFMLDVGRNFQSMASLKKQLSIMARYKLNVFHWHLTDRPAWRIESHIYPELTAAENHRSSRDPGKFYTYDDIRELIDYAKQRSIQIIPEIDMPGHSDSFVTSMGVQMGSEKGMDILENILKEFFSEISADLCPIIHLGSDEVRIPDPDKFISRMVGICESYDRQVMIWNPGLKAHPKVIRQTWQSKHLEAQGYTEIDSWDNYTNNGEAMIQVAKLFFKPIGYKSQNKVIGAIQCLWPDVNLDNESDAFVINPHYPVLLTHAWACWTSDILKPHDDYLTLLPENGTAAAKYFEAFEHFLLDHKNRFFSRESFPYHLQSDKFWKVALGNNDTQYADLDWKIAKGNTLIFKDRFKQGGYFPEARPGQVAYAETTIESETDKEIEVQIGFETPLRANRVYSGIPENGSWDANGGEIWINGEELKGPKWENPGWKPLKTSGWGSKIDQEIPWAYEELYWTRKPVLIRLKKGTNVIRLMAPYNNEYQNWMITFIPLN